MAFVDWSDHENRLIVADYFSMLIDELRGLKVNKAQHRKALIPLLNNRPDGSVEFKHQNISAVLAEMGLPYINGYKPRYNFQRLKLIAAVDEFVRSNKSMETLFEQFSDTVPHEKKDVQFTSWLVPPPELKQAQIRFTLFRKPININYLEREQENKGLGFRGEELVFEYERQLLISLGKESLADQIEWVSKEQGDGLGFDILSKNQNGTDKYVEVKTTKLSKETPFYFSSNEYNFSVQKNKDFHLYRVFDFSKDPKLFTLNGSLDKICRMDATHFIGRF